MIRQPEEKALIEVGAVKRKPEVFNTAVFGFKKMKKTTLSFQEEIWLYLVAYLLNAMYDWAMIIRNI